MVLILAKNPRSHSAKWLRAAVTLHNPHFFLEHTPHFPPPLQCLQELQFLHAVQDAEPVHVASEVSSQHGGAA
jgi:hypothetical protein